MPQEPATCPKCGSPMECGYVPERGHQNYYALLRWSKGTPRKGFFGNIKVDLNGLPLAAFRCTACGLLEFYADRSFEA